MDVLILGGFSTLDLWRLKSCLLREVTGEVGLDLTDDTFELTNGSQYIDHCKANLYFATTTVKPDVKVRMILVGEMRISEMRNTAITNRHTHTHTHTHTHYM